jgi:hypothetical protein
MLIFDSESKPIILDSIFVPTLTDHFWVLDLAMLDYTLAPLVTLEQVVCPSLQVQVLGFEFIIPANWNILVYDRETCQLDTIEVAEAAGRQFNSLVYGPQKSRAIPGQITITNYYLEYVNVGPTLNKHQMLCHPIGPDVWVNVAPSDTYNKYLKDLTLGDIIGG